MSEFEMRYQDEFNPDYVVLPGESISEMLEEYSMSQKELAKRMGITPKTVGEIIKGRTAITPHYAQSLSSILGLPASYWLNLQRNYDDDLYEMERKKELEEQVKLANDFPRDSLKKMGLLPKGRIQGIELVQRLLDIFKVAKLEQVTDYYSFDYNCRISSYHEVDDLALATWMRLGEVEAEQKYDYNELCPFKPEEVYNNFHKLREICRETDASEFLGILSNCCRDLGIIFVVVPEIKGSRISGMARWIRHGKRKIPMIQLSMRGKRHDMFCFTFFHELGHILLHSSDDVFVDIEKKRKIDDKENEADEFARNILIPDEKYVDYIKEITKSGTNINRNNIKSFADELDVHPGIVVGRLQFEEELLYSQCNDLKITYKWDFEKK